MLEDNNPNLHNDLFNEDPNKEPFYYHPRKSLARSNCNIIFAGVCAGIGETYNFDIGIIRLTAILSLLFGGWSIVAYLLTAFLLPVRAHIKEQTTTGLENQKRENFKTVASGAFILAGLHFLLNKIGFGNFSGLFILHAEPFIPLILIAYSIFLLRKRENGELKIYPTSKFFRDKNSRLILGVCSGLAKYLEIDVLILRIIFILLCGLTLGFLVVVYLMLALFTSFEKQPVGEVNE